MVYALHMLYLFFINDELVVDSYLGIASEEVKYRRYVRAVSGWTVMYCVTHRNVGAAECIQCASGH